MSEPELCGLPRRLAAITYDALLIFALLMIATAIVLPFAKGDAFTNNNLLYDIYLATVCYVYFSWQWIHGGQTLGMRAWKIKVVTLDNQSIGWVDASKRAVYSILSWLIFALGFLWSLFNKDRYTLHDYLSKTKLIIFRQTTPDVSTDT